VSRAVLKIPPIGWVIFFRILQHCGSEIRAVLTISINRVYLKNRISFRSLTR